MELAAVPNAGPFVHYDETDAVRATILGWLNKYRR